MKRLATIAAALLLSLGLAAIVPTGEPAPLTDDAYCKNWCCERVCNEKNQCYRYCWCCG